MASAGDSPGRPARRRVRQGAQPPSSGGLEGQRRRRASLRAGRRGRAAEGPDPGRTGRCPARGGVADVLGAAAGVRHAARGPPGARSPDCHLGVAAPGGWNLQPWAPSLETEGKPPETRGPLASRGRPAPDGLWDQWPVSYPATGGSEAEGDPDSGPEGSGDVGPPDPGPGGLEAARRRRRRVGRAGRQRGGRRLAVLGAPGDAFGGRSSRARSRPGSAGAPPRADQGRGLPPP